MGVLFICSANNGSTRSLSISVAVIGVLVVYNLAKSHLAVSVDPGLLINATDTLHGANIKRVLRP